MDVSMFLPNEKKKFSILGIKLVTCLASNNSESITAFPKHFSKVTNQCSGLFISSKMSSGGMVNFEDKRRANIGGPASSHGR